jgi:hypothetical protein
MKDRLIVGCIVLCILLNGFVPRFSIDQRDYEVLNQILQSQSILIQFFSCSSLPLKIVTDLFSQPGAADTPKKSSGQHLPAANASADYSLMSLDNKLAGSRSQFTRTAVFGTDLSLHRVASSVKLTVDQMNYPISPHPVFFAIILMFFFLFPRSSIPEGVIMLFRVRGNIFSQFAYANWDFSLINDILERSAV